jgi:putative endonuclease
LTRANAPCARAIVILSEGGEAAGVEGSSREVAEPSFRKERGMSNFYVYILASHSRTLYIGVTNELERRVYEHKTKAEPGSFTAKYNIDRLVYYEETTDAIVAIEREKQLKGWTRAKKIALIERMNPLWEDLSDCWYDRRSEESTRQSRSVQDPSTSGGCAAFAQDDR